MFSMGRSPGSRDLTRPLQSTCRVFPNVPNSQDSRALSGVDARAFAQMVRGNPLRTGC